jgi:hypothetical protein
MLMKKARREFPDGPSVWRLGVACHEDTETRRSAAGRNHWKRHSTVCGNEELEWIGAIDCPRMKDAS